MHIGKDNTARQSLEKIKAINTEIEIVILGECSQEQVAYYLKRIDIGLSNYPKILYEKSGSIAAMLYNGIPVILLKDSFEYDYRIIPELKELKEIKDIKEFLEQKKNFFVNYGVINASREYLKIFSK